MTHPPSSLSPYPHSARTTRAPHTPSPRAQWFNLFNCRSIGGEWEPFANFKDSTYGMLIQLIIAFTHYLLVELGGSIMQTVPLTSNQWAMCVAIGVTSLAWGGVVVTPIARCFPDAAKQSLGQPHRASHGKGDKSA